MVKLGDLTKYGKVYWIDNISEHVPDPLIKVEKVEGIKYRASELSPLIQRANIFKKTEDELLIEWAGSEGYGQLGITYNDNGKYTIDAEFMALDTIIEIIKQI